MLSYTTLKLLIMNSKITLLFMVLAVVEMSFGQVKINPDGSGNYKFNPENTPCLTQKQKQSIHQALQTSMTSLRENNRLAYSDTQRGSHPLFIWPVQGAAGTNYNSVWGISNYVDHNANGPNLLLDYNCGTRTYDTSDGYDHQGLDIYLWPFSWKMMDEGAAEIVAAASGQIIYKSDGNFDRSCDFSTTTPWNAVYIQHSDGSVAWYGHMKNGSTTTKNVGDMVAQGEYLGTVGSSGVSTGPHLHFEVYNANSQLIDPYSGACNSTNPDSWWQSQKPYLNPGVNAAFTQTAPTNFSSCPNQETTYLSDTFDTDDTIYFMAYLRDQVNGSTTNLRILKPDNSVLYAWDYTFNINYYSSWVYWNYTGVFDMNGIWTWEVTYGGETVAHTFEVSGVLGVDEQSIQDVNVYPNPVEDVLIINSNQLIVRSHLTDILGKTIVSLESLSEGISSIDTSKLSDGIYFLRLESANNSVKTVKLIKK